MGNAQNTKTEGQVQSVGGKSLIRLANLLASRICWTIAEAERLKGSAPNTPEIVVVFHENYGRRINYAYLNAFI